MSKERKDNHFIKKPFYEGGITALRKFIKENLKYPKEALEKKIEGTVLVKYDIDYTGKVTEAKVLKGIGHGCNEEAKRLIKLLKYEVPKGPRKLKVSFHKETKINFRLPKEKPANKPVPKAAKVITNQGQLSIKYTITPKSGKPKEVKKTYNYTI
jgi:TonB family protein